MDLVKQKGIVINELSRRLEGSDFCQKTTRSSEKLFLLSRSGTSWTISFKLENRDLRTDMYKDVRITATSSMKDSFPVRLGAQPLHPWEDLTASLLRELESMESTWTQLPLI